jgi:uncharacterized protein YqeY
MSLIARIEGDLKDAMRARDEVRTGTLRLALASLRAEEKKERRALREDEELAILARERNRRIEAAAAFRQAGRDEQAAREELELEIVASYMPEPLSETELEALVDLAIAGTGATSLRDLGKVMGWLKPEIAGRADGGVVSQIVREKLVG